MDKNKSFREVVGETIGEASMCWSETPTGVFDSERAVKLVDRVMAHVDRKTELEVILMGFTEKMRPLLNEWSELNKE